MLDGLKKPLEALIATSREERAALTMMLSQIQLHSAKLAAATRTLQEVEQRSVQAERRLDDIMGRMTQVNDRTNDVEALEMRLRTLSDAVTEAERSLEARMEALNAEVAQLRALSAQLALDFRALKEPDRAREMPAAEEGDVETLRSRVEAVTVQVTDARRKLEGVSAIQARLLPLTAQLTSLKTQIEKGEVIPPRPSS